MPRPVRRRLVFDTPGSAYKRQRTQPMATKKTTLGRFRSLTKRNTFGPKKNGSLAQQIKSLQRVVKNLAPEIKYVDVDVSATNVTTAGAVVHMTAIGQGDTQGTRTGTLINVVSITVKGIWTRVADNQALNSKMQIAIVVDKEQVADTNPTAAQIFSSTDPIVTFPNLDHLDRFRILHLSPMYDARMLGLDSDQTTVYAPTRDNKYEFQWKGNLKVAYNGTASTDIEKNGCFIVLLTNDAGAYQDFFGSARIGYTDV